MTDQPSEFTKYESPLISRYASKEMAAVFSPRHRAFLWRDLWIALAESEKQLGLPITSAQIDELKANRNVLDEQEVARLEKETRHEVIAHIRHLGDVCPKARPIIHLGATSAFVMDNGDLLQLREGLIQVSKRIADVLRAGLNLARKTSSLPVLGYTHLQPAQPTTLGKRVCLWLQDFLMDLQDCERVIKTMRFRGVKGATGTQASFMRLFDDDSSKVKELDQLVSEKLGFNEAFRVTGQTYPRKVDSAIMHGLLGLAQSAHKMSNDIRFLQTVGEAEEPFGDAQVGSSAMAYKRNPMRSERIAGLSRLLLTTGQNAHWNAANQWMERTLDDSSNRRLALAESFLIADAVLILCKNVLSGFTVSPATIARRLRAQLPLLATEDILMAAVASGGDRQDLHERIRQHSMASVHKMREEGSEQSDLLTRLDGDPAFASVKGQFDTILNPRRLTGRAEEQVDDFLTNELEPALAPYPHEVTGAEVRV